MSAGAFANVKYESDDGVLHPIRVQPETVALTIGGAANNVPPEPAGTTKSKISARVGGSRSGIGLYARMVYIKFGDTEGAQPDGYKRGGRTAVPILTQSLFGAITKNDTGNYLGKVVTVTGLSAEVVG